MTPSSGESLPSDRASTEPFPLFPPQHLSDSHNDIGTSSALPDNVASQSLSHNPIRLRKPSDHIVKLPGDNTGPAFATSSAMRDPNPPPQAQSKRRSNRRKFKSAARRIKTTLFKHTWSIPLILISAVLSVYLASPGKHNLAYSAIFLSYPLRPHPDDPSTTIYSKGLADFAFVVFYTVVLSFTREFIMQVLLSPLAARCGITKRSRRSRFMEQVYSAIYFGISSPLGLYVMWRSPVWYFSTPGMYIGFPHRELEGIHKAYYLLQASYWAQQAIVLLLQLEKPRKDFRELVGHHIITLSLIGLSYQFHFTYMGLAVYITHDISDFFLATSKTLSYLDSALVEPYFAIFMFSWVYMRHYINLRILASFIPYISVGNNPHPLAVPEPQPMLTFNVPGVRDTVYVWPSQFSSIGSYELNWDRQQYKCWVSQLVTFFLLACLQFVNLFWLYLICRVAKRFIIDGEKKDERSEGEDEDE